MNVQTKMMSSVFLFLSLFFYMHDVNAFHIDKPKISINFFDEFVPVNESLLNDDSLNTNLTTSNSNVGKDAKKEAILTDDFFQLHDQNKTSHSAPVQFLELDRTAEADITNMTPIEPDELDYSTIVSTSPDLLDPELLEPEITRIFFLKAIANLIEHIMETLFSVGEPPKQSSPHNYDYDLMPSRSLKKRNLPSAEGTNKTSDEDRSVEHTSGTETSTLKDTSASTKSKSENNHTEYVSSNDTHVSFVQSNADAETKINKVESTTGHSSHTSSSTRVSSHVSSHHGSHKTTDVKPHVSTEKSEAKSIATVKSHHETDSHPDRKVEHEAKLITHRNVQKVAISAPEENKRMFDFRDESSMLNDEVTLNKDNHYLRGEDHDEHLADEDHVHNHEESSSFLTVLLVSTTFMILLILVAFGIAAAYFFQKYKTQSSNQNASNLHSVVA